MASDHQMEIPSLGAVQDRWEDSENMLPSWLSPEISFLLQD